MTSVLHSTSLPSAVLRENAPSILLEIATRKAQEVAQRQALYPVALLERSPWWEGPALSLNHYLTRPGSSGLIAEFKRASPSKGLFNRHAQAKAICTGYMQAGAAALSILTDEPGFGGKNEDLSQARAFNYCPILRKDFILDEYQVVEARSIGADVVLLIASLLPPERIRTLAQFARSLGLEVLLEVHNAEELETCFCPEVTALGVNNRNLHDFSESLEISFALAERIPAGVVKISESALRSPEAVQALRQVGYQGFLIGETFMRQPDPAVACATFIRALEELSHGTD